MSYDMLDSMFNNLSDLLSLEAKERKKAMDKAAGNGRR